MHDREPGIRKRSLDATLKQARAQQEASKAEAERERRFAERQDPRAFIRAPLADAEWLPQMSTLNEVLGNCPATVPPIRDADRSCAELRAISVPTLSRLSKEEANR